MEGLRQPAFFFIFAAAALMIGLSPAFALFHLGEGSKMVTDLGLSTILTFSTLLALLTASSAITDEIEGRTAVTMLAKPLRREEFLLGKFFGVATATSALIALLAPVFLITLRGQKFMPEQDPWFCLAALCSLALALFLFGALLVLRLLFQRGLSLLLSFWLACFAGMVFLVVFLAIEKAPEASWDWQLLIGVFFICLHGWVISAAVVALATRFTLVQAAIGTGVFFIIGHVSGALVAPFRTVENTLTPVGLVLRAILPDLDQFNLTDALSLGYLDKACHISADVIAGSTLYALLYGAALLTLAAALLSKRELG
jgi:ABC-type transport system involved in multi-copper enzyme maturation permease subunit